MTQDSGFEPIHSGPRGSSQNPDSQQKIAKQISTIVEQRTDIEPEQNSVTKKKKKKKKSDGFVWTRIKKVENLASQGKVYPVDVSIQYRAFTFGEVEESSDTSLDELDKILLLEKGIRIHGMEVDDLTVGDFFWICLLRKLNTFGTSEIQVTITDENGEPYKHRVNLMDISFADIDVDLPITVENLFGEEVIFSPLRLGRYKKLLQKGYDFSDNSVALAAQQQCIPLKRMIRYIKTRATLEDLTILRVIDDMLYHGPKPIDIPIKYREPNPDFDPDDPEKCKNIPYVEKTRGAVTVDLDDPTVIVTPFRESAESVTNRIRFGHSRSLSPNGNKKS